MKQTLVWVFFLFFFSSLFFAPFLKHISKYLLWGLSKTNINSTLGFIILWSIQPFHTQQSLPDDPKVLFGTGAGTRSELGSGCLRFPLVPALGDDRVPFIPLFHPPHNCLLGGAAEQQSLVYDVPKTQMGTPRLEPSGRKSEAWSCGYRENPRPRRLSPRSSDSPMLQG